MPENLKNIETQKNWDFLKDSYFIWDSLSDGISRQNWKIDWSIKVWAKTDFMLSETEKNISKIKEKKFLFFLGGTNDVASWVSAEKTIENIRKIWELARKNWVEFVPWTIPFMKKFEKNKEIQTKIEEINNFIKTNFPNFIDYNSLTKDFKQSDWVHFDTNWYSAMRKAQEQKFSEIIWNWWEKAKDFKWEIDQYLENTVNSLKVSIVSFDSKVNKVFSDGKKMTKEQKQKMDEIINLRKTLIIEFEKISEELSKSKYELIFRENQLGNNKKNSKEFMEILNRASDLEKIILELDEKQAILLKNFKMAKHGIKINEKISSKETEEMLEITSIDFISKPFDSRLKYVTIWNIETEEVKNGNIKELEINFSFNGRFNRQLYLNTTAGMILPNEVREVSVNWVNYSRNENALKWEFFDKNWKRLIISDETKITIVSLENKVNLEKKFFSKLDLTKFSKESDKEIAIESEKRWIPLEIALWLFSEEMWKIEDKKFREILLEELFVEIDRRKWDFVNKYKKSPIKSDWKFSLEFLSFLFDVDNSAYEKTSKSYGYNDVEINQTKKERETRVLNYSWDLNLEKFASLNISKEEVEKIRKMKKFIPNSADTVTLFRIAAKVAWISESWATNQNLHYILGRESAWDVWRVNYTLARKWISTEELKTEALKWWTSKQISKRLWASSTANGLWQLLLSNIDVFYPSGRKWIWDPVEEAVWFLRYIKERYWSPDVARSVYGKKWTFTHAITGKKTSKDFREWY